MPSKSCSLIFLAVCPCRQVAFRDLLSSTAPAWDDPAATGLLTRFHEPYTYSPTLTMDGNDGFDAASLETVHSHAGAGGDAASLEAAVASLLRPAASTAAGAVTAQARGSCTPCSFFRLGGFLCETGFAPNLCMPCLRC